MGLCFYEFNSQVVNPFLYGVLWRDWENGYEAETMQPHAAHGVGIEKRPEGTSTVVLTGPHVHVQHAAAYANDRRCC